MVNFKVVVIPFLPLLDKLVGTNLNSLLKLLIVYIFIYIFLMKKMQGWVDSGGGGGGG